jgi:hypothetical protein
MKFMQRTTKVHALKVERGVGFFFAFWTEKYTYIRKKRAAALFEQR